MNKKIERAVARLLQKSSLTIAVAESCTGGLLGHRITEIPGSSGYFTGGIIAYGNSVKTSLLGVKRKTLLGHGAVSRHTAAEMARGVRKALGAAIGISVTGIAGPGGGTREKPVGLVYIGLAARRGIVVEKHLFRGSRRQIKAQAAQRALLMLRKFISSTLK